MSKSTNEKLLEMFGENIYPSESLQLDLGSYGGQSDLFPDLNWAYDEGVTLQDNDWISILEACIDGFKEYLREEHLKDFSEVEINSISRESLNGILNEERTVGRAVLNYETHCEEEYEEGEE